MQKSRKSESGLSDLSSLSDRQSPNKEKKKHVIKMNHCTLGGKRNIMFFDLLGLGRKGRKGRKVDPYVLVAILGKRVAMSLNEPAQRSQAFPSNILLQAGLDFVEVQFECPLSLQARYTKNQSVAWAVIRDRDSIDRRRPSQPETASRQAVRFDVQANGEAVLATILR